MKRLIDGAHIVLLLAAAALCASGALFFWHLDAAVASNSYEANQALRQVETAAAGVTDTLTAINRPCGTDKPCGTLADVAKTLNTARLTLGQVEVAANHEDRRLGVLDAQESQFSADTHFVLVKAATDLDSLDTTIQAVQPVTANAAGTLGQLQRFAESLNGMTPALERTASELAATSENVTATSQHLNATTGEVQQAVHSYLHPSWPTRVWHAITNLGVEAGKFFF